MKPVQILLLTIGLFVVAQFSSAQTWTQTSAPSTNSWFSIASSADGSKLVAVSPGGGIYSGGIYISSNSGLTWTQTSAPFNYWGSVASSADGNKLVAVSDNEFGGSPGQIYVSTNSGANWAPTADGNKLVAVTFDSPPSGRIYTSTNSGTTWTQQTNAPNKSWSSVACSADGSKLVVQNGFDFGSIYKSTNSGVTWLQAGNLPFQGWGEISGMQVIASSADGCRLVAAFRGSENNIPVPICISTNSGTTWVATSSPSNYWACVASSADGSKLAAAAWNNSSVNSSPGPIYTSTDSGTTWVSNNVPSQPWSSIAYSADGGRLVAAAGWGPVGPIYTSQSILRPSLNLAPSSGNLTLSWTVPSTNFVVQQSSDLQNWTNSIITPTLNLTNLQEQVILPPTNGSGFYRLKTP